VTEYVYRTPDGELVHLGRVRAIRAEDGRQASRGTVLAPSWTDADRAEFNVFPLKRAVIPRNQRVIERTLALENGEAIERVTLEDVIVARHDVNRERERRIAAGAPVALSTGKTFTVQTREGRDFRNVQALVTLAQIRAANGVDDTVTFRDADNVDRTLTPGEVVEMGLQVTAHVDAHYKAAWRLKDRDPIPKDFDADEHWP